MAKIKTLLKQKESSKNILINKNKLIPYSPTKEILNEDFIGKAILECLKNNDSQGVIEVISTYLNTMNKIKSAKIASLPRSTLYHSLKGKNPTIKTLAKLIHASTLELKK